jgi:hypothetical protein
MSNREIAQEQINKEKEEQRILLIKKELIRIENLKREVENIEKYLTELETKDIILSGNLSGGFATITANMGYQGVSSF